MTDAEQTHAPGVPEQSLPPVVIQVPAPPPLPYDETLSVAFGTHCNVVYAESGAPIDAGMISVQASRFTYDVYVLRLPAEDAALKHLNDLRAIYALPPVDHL